MRFTLILALLVGSVWGNISQRIQEVDNLLSTDGPTGNVLKMYEDLIRDLESGNESISSLPKLYFKKALISLSLNKQASAIADLKKCLSLDPSMVTAKNKLIDLHLERGEFKEIFNYVSENDSQYSSLKEQENLYFNSLSEAQLNLNNGDFQSCLSTLENGAMSISPNKIEPYKLHLNCLKLKSKSESNQEIFRDIVKDLTSIIKISPVQSLDTYHELSTYLLYTQNQFEQSWKVVKNCLRIDNDFKSCGELSKFYSKYQEFLKLFERYTIMNGYYYFQGENTNDIDEGLTLSTEDFKFIKNYLFNDALKVSKLEKRKLPYSINTNYDYLLWKVETFKKQEKYTNEQLIFIQDLQKLACESSVHSGDTKSKYCKLIQEDDNNPFLPKHIHAIDSLLKNKKYNEAKNALEKQNANVRKSLLFKSRYKEIEAFERLQQEHRQREQQRFHHQHQQQQRHQYHHRQQQHHQQRQPPKNDYYKILDIAKDADEKTIKKAHRAQTLKYHPDKYKGGELTPEQIEAKMQEINAAYEVLSNPEKRAKYDQGIDPNDTSGGQGPQNFGQNFHFDGFDTSQFFSQFMGGNGGGFQFNFGGNGAKGRSRRTTKRRRA